MESSSKARILTDIGATAKQHADMGCQLLAAHALIGVILLPSCLELEKQRQ